MKRNYLKNCENVGTIKIRIDYQARSFRGLFENCESISSNNVITMNDMFSGCSSLKELNLSNFNTIKVIDMSYMFSRCSSLEELNISNFNINHGVIKLNDKFYGCSDELKRKALEQN